MRACETNFRNVNRDGRWPDFRWEGLERLADGTLRLPALPRLVPPAQQAPSPQTQQATEPAQALTAPAGVTIDWDDSIFYSDPEGHRLFKIDGCTGRVRPVPCAGPQGTAASSLDTPRGLLIPAHRRVLAVVDAGNHRVQMFDPETGELRDVLGASGLPQAPEPSDEPGRFNEPWAIAGDAAGNLYVVDHGNRRVQKFDRAGVVDPLFWRRMHAEGVLDEPADVAVAGGEDDIYVYVLDRTQRRILRFDHYGRCDRDGQGEPWQISDRLSDPMGLAVTNAALFVGDNTLRRVLQFSITGQPRFIGEAVGFEGPVAALALDRKGLLVHGGGSEPPLTLTLAAGHGSTGALWGGPFEVECPEFTWRHVHASAAVPQRGAHLRFFWQMRPAGAAAPHVDPGSADPLPESEGWRAVAPDLTHFFVDGERSQRLWIGAQWTGDGSSTATLSQLRLEFDGESYLKSLPVIYQKEAGCGRFFDRFLALFESVFGETEDEIRALPSLIDPDSMPPAGLPWLASWLGIELDERWDEETRRDAIRQAYARHARAGTVRGLRDAIERESGVQVVIMEPLQHAGWWVLPSPAPSCGTAGAHHTGSCCASCAGDHASSPAAASTSEWVQTGQSVLGWTTALVAAEPQGAIVGTTATLDASHLITDEDFAAPLFDDLAYQIQILVYPSAARDPRTLERVRAIVEREKPAHVTYHLCVARPELRLGIQARLGVDAIVSGEPSPTPLARPEMGGGALVLGGSPRGQVGPRSRVGVTTRL
jgi:phage tail-like protein